MTDLAGQGASFSDAGGFPLPETSPVVILDDDADLAESLGAFMSSQQYPVRTHFTADEALADLASAPAGLLLVDLDLGAASGLDVARKAMELDPGLAIIMITGQGSESSAAECLRLGLSDYLVKPFELAALRRAVQRALMRRSTELRRFSNEERLRQKVTELQAERRSLAARALGDIVASLEAKHPCLAGHSLRVARIARAVGRELGFPEPVLERIRIAGHLHDLGMVAVPDQVLHQTGALDTTDLERIRSHPRIGADLLRRFGLTEVAGLVELHHERLDGSGYPDGLQGSQIPAGALVVGLAEAYSALTEPRPHRDAAPPGLAIDTLRGAAGLWFPEAMIDALERARGEIDEGTGSGPDPSEPGPP